MRKEFEMTKEDFDDLLNACISAPIIILKCEEPPTPQDIANAAWKPLGEKMGFDHLTVQPVDGKPDTFFTAEEILPVSPPEPIYVSCPFCKEKDFDFSGLRGHLVNGWCDSDANSKRND